MLDRAFRDLDAAEVVSGTPVEHARSVRLLRRLGFVQPDAQAGFFRLSRHDWETGASGSAAIG
jgi:RimJ/RimL family protein N-acetyltransferase